jgi:hypothetical protein
MRRALIAINFWTDFWVRAARERMLHRHGNICV